MWGLQISAPLILRKDMGVKYVIESTGLFVEYEPLGTAFFLGAEVSFVETFSKEGRRPHRGWCRKGDHLGPGQGKPVPRTCDGCPGGTGVAGSEGEGLGCSAALPKEDVGLRREPHGVRQGTRPLAAFLVSEFGVAVHGLLTCTPAKRQTGRPVTMW